MKISKILLSAVIVTCITTATAFAAPVPSSPADTNDNKQQKSDTLKKDKKQSIKNESKQQDPIKVLEEKKVHVQTLLKEGKITKEKADEITAKLDARIKEVNEFNKLTLEQKKQKLTSKFKESLDRRIQEGRLTQEEADEALKKFNEKLEKWDGNGYPPFGGKGMKHRKQPCPDCKNLGK